MSYAQNKNPGFKFFCVLFVTTIFMLNLFPTSVIAINLLGLLWGVFILNRALSLIEVIDLSKNAAKDTVDLPSAILNYIDLQQNLQRAKITLNAFQKDLLLWFILGFTFVIYKCINAQPEYSDISTLLSSYFILGAVFWGTLTYARTQSCRNNVFYLALSSYIITLLINLSSNHLNFSDYPTLSPNNFFGFALWIFTFLKIAYEMGKKRNFSPINFFGIIALILTGLLHIHMNSGSYLHLWSSTLALSALGWSQIPHYYKKQPSLYLTGYRGIYSLAST